MDGAEGTSAWVSRYGAKHRWARLAEFPRGIAPPKKVRIYHRSGHYLLNWWDPGAKKNLSERVEGDLLAALARARDVDGRVAELRTAGVGGDRRIDHAALDERFLADLSRRAEAGEVGPETGERYRSALGHYLAYCAEPAVTRAFPAAARVNREFRLGLTAFLADRSVPRNGRAGSAPRPMRGQAFVVDVVRTVFEWAADPDRGGLLPAGFANPFRRAGAKRDIFRGDPLADPDITPPMAVDFVRACDGYELRLFVPLILFGLRAAEPCWLFREHVRDDWLLVPNLPGLDYQTKGRRDKRLPLPADLGGFWDRLRTEGSGGLLCVRRAVAAGREKPPCSG